MPSMAYNSLCKQEHLADGCSQVLCVLQQVVEQSFALQTPCCYPNSGQHAANVAAMACGGLRSAQPSTAPTCCAACVTA